MLNLIDTSKVTDKYCFIGGLWGVPGVLLQTYLLGLVRGFMYIQLESLVIGSYIYHSDVIAGMQLCYKSS